VGLFPRIFQALVNWTRAECTSGLLAMISRSCSIDVRYFENDVCRAANAAPNLALVAISMVEAAL